MTITVTKQYRTETGHRLREYVGKCQHLHGHSYLWEVTAEADELDHRGIAVDFKDLKAAMVEVLEPLDHCLVLRADDPLLASLVEEGEDERLITLASNPTAEEFARYAGERIDLRMPPGVRITQVKVWETATSFATWRP